MPLPNSGDITGSYKMSDIRWSKGRHYYSELILGAMVT